MTGRATYALRGFLLPTLAILLILGTRNGFAIVSQCPEGNFFEGCNVEMYRSGYWFGVHGWINTADFNSGVMTNSFNLIHDADNIVEVGVTSSTRGEYKPFAVWKYGGGPVNEVDGPVMPLGNRRYYVRYYAADPPIQAHWTYAAVNWWTFTLPPYTWTNGIPITNAEREFYDSIWYDNPHFWGLQALSSSTWSNWPSASGYFDNDPDYYAYNGFSANEVYVFAG